MMRRDTEQKSFNTAFTLTNVNFQCKSTPSLVNTQHLNAMVRVVVGRNKGGREREREPTLPNVLFRSTREIYKSYFIT